MQRKASASTGLSAYKDIAPWYSYVEKFAGISGNRDGIPHLPDGEFQPPTEMNCIEKHLKQSIESNYEERHLIISRTANLTRGLKDRGPCQYRNFATGVVLTADISAVTLQRFRRQRPPVILH
jgi:hypothetical protein